MTTTREAFEAWMVNVAKIIVGSTDPYPAGLERDYRQVWKAATAAERERCALVCEKMTARKRWVHAGANGIVMPECEIAAAIRQPLPTGTGGNDAH